MKTSHCSPAGLPFTHFALLFAGLAEKKNKCFKCNFQCKINIRPRLLCKCKHWRDGDIRYRVNFVYL